LQPQRKIDIIKTTIKVTVLWSWKNPVNVINTISFDVKSCA